MEIVAAGKTDIGKKRAINEDSLGVFPELGLFVVADGMGGHAAGEVASRMAVEAIQDFIAATAGEGGISWSEGAGGEEAEGPSAARIAAAVRVANRAIYEKAAERPSEMGGMGTTVVAALFVDDSVSITHSGDSRAYLYRDNKLMRLTRDHSHVQDMLLAGYISEAQARTHPFRNVITSALGSRPDILIETATHAVRPGDVFLFCSDGLHGLLTDDDISGIIAGKFFTVRMPGKSENRYIDRDATGKENGY